MVKLAKEVRSEGDETQKRWKAKTMRKEEKKAMRSGSKSDEVEMKIMEIV
jgi:hypothetical protein